MLNSPAEQGEHVQRLSGIKGLGEEPAARARLKFRTVLHIQRAAAQRKAAGSPEALLGAGRGHAELGL